MPCWWRSERLNLGLCYSGVVEALSRCLWLVDVGTLSCFSILTDLQHALIHLGCL